MEDHRLPDSAQLQGHGVEQRRPLQLPHPRPQRRRLESGQQGRRSRAPHRADRAAVTDGDTRQRQRQTGVAGPVEQRRGDDQQVRRPTAVAGGPWETIAYPTTRSYTATGLTNGTKYYFRILAHNAAGWGTLQHRRQRHPRTVPTAPQSPTATAGLYSAYLTWQKPASTGGAAIDKYIIEHRRYAEQEWKVLGETTASVLSYKAIGLTQIGNSHLFRIRAHNAAGSGAESTVVDRFPLTEPERPWNLTATLNNGTVELKWAAPYDGGTPIQKYVVQQAINEGMFKTIGYPTTGSYTATVQPGLTYHYQIYAHNAAGNSAPSTTVSVTIPPKVPSAPTNCNAYQLGGKGSDTLRIEWGPPTSNGGAPILFYTIFVWGDPYQPPVMQTSVWNPNTSYDADIAVGEGGWVAVFAYNKAGGGPACQSVPFYMYP